MTAAPLTLAHATLVDAGGVVEDGWVRFEGGTIAATGRGAPPVRPGAVVDLGGDLLAPGFIDLHNHAAGELDERVDVAAALAPHRARGTTRAVLSIVSRPVHELTTALAAARRAVDAVPGVLGAHLEGPALSPARRGAHDERHLRSLDRADLNGLLAAADGALRQTTLAPERPGAERAIAMLVAEGVVVAVGHTEAGYEQTRRAFDAGASLLTHAFNAMPPLHHRDPGPIGAAIDDDRVRIELILDLVHVHPTAARLLFAAAGPRVALVSDAMAAATRGDGRFTLGGLDVDVRGGRATLSGTDTLAGSTLTLDVALRNAVLELALSPVDAVAALTETPARALGLHDRFGRLAPGFAADAVRLDDSWRVRSVWLDGIEEAA